MDPLILYLVTFGGVLLIFVFHFLIGANKTETIRDEEHIQEIVERFYPGARLEDSLLCETHARALAISNQEDALFVLFVFGLRWNARKFLATSITQVKLSQEGDIYRLDVYIDSYDMGHVFLTLPSSEEERAQAWLHKLQQMQTTKG